MSKNLISKKKHFKKIVFSSLLSSLITFNFAYANTPKDTLIIVQRLDDIISIDPAESFELSSIQTLPSLYQKLVNPSRENPDEVGLDLATKYDVDASNKTITFYLDEKAQFSSGNPVTADDVIFSLSRAVKLNKAPAFILGVLGYTPENVDAHLSKIDEKTVTLKWTSDIGAPVVLSVLTSPIASIVDSKVVNSHSKDNDFGNQWLKSNAAGSGPFVLKA